MDNESEVIQRQMEETRSSLQDKLETLEQQVTTTVQEATEAVGETVESVKEAVQETVDTVKETVQETVETVKSSFDITQHVEAHPWTMFLGATAVGFAATYWLQRSNGVSHWRMNGEQTEDETSFEALDDRPAYSKATSKPGVLAGLGSWAADHYSGEIAKVKELALGSLGAVIRDMVVSVAPVALASQIKEVANDFTQKMGGRVIVEPVLKSNSDARESKEMNTAATTV